jgi:hypothetical protein
MRDEVDDEILVMLEKAKVDNESEPMVFVFNRVTSLAHGAWLVDAKEDVEWYESLRDRMFENLRLVEDFMQERDLDKNFRAKELLTERGLIG